MSSEGSVTIWLRQLRAGDPGAAQPLWESYFSRLVALARTRLQGRPRAVADEEDAVLSAFDSFCCGVREGRFPRLDDRNDLWQILVLLTARKVTHHLRREGAQKRGGGEVRHASALSDEETALLEDAIGAEPTPHFAAEVAEECERLLGLLGEPELRSVALWKLEGYSNAEIAGKLGVVERTVERRLNVIRKLWNEGNSDA